jgi:YD repeat-containing protein
MGDFLGPLFVQEEIPIRDSVIGKFGIESVTGKTFEIKNGIPAPPGFKSHLLMCDGARKRTLQKYNREGLVIHEWIYNDRGELLREIDSEGSGKINYRIESIYGHEINWTEKQVYLSGNEIHYRIVADRDPEGRLTEGTYYDSSDQRIRTDSYIYDDRGRLVKVSMGHLGEWIYEYDENDNLKRMTGNLASSSGFGENFEFEYEERELLIKRSHLNYEVTIFDYTLSV